MSQDDAKIIFTNVVELAVFSDGFCDELERALGSLVDGGVGEDRVGELFLQIIPDLRKPYQLYIIKHSGALQHLQNLPQTPALQAYLSYTRSIASSVSHAWDLASLLIKPVQRLLNYPPLLSAIIDETPDSHPDKENLQQARALMEEVVQNINEASQQGQLSASAGGAPELTAYQLEFEQPDQKRIAELVIFPLRAAYASELALIRDVHIPLALAELAVFSHGFCEQLELALGSLIDGGVGEDRVGELLLQIIPDLEKPYQLYISKHPGALQHLYNLTQTPSLQAYLSHTQSVASSMSHSWDLACLLIKPVHRLLKYPVFLSTIIDETPDSHPDKENLRQARTMMEQVARNVNGVRRRKGALTSKKKPVNTTVAAFVNLGKLKNTRVNKTQPVDENKEAAQVERMSQELKRIELFAQQFAKNIIDWARSMSKVVGALRAWSIGFGKVIGLSPEQGSEAFEAFLTLVERQLMPLCVNLEAVIHERVLREIVYLLKAMNQPYKLLESMTEQEPLYYHLLSLNVSAKNRPPQTLLAASTTYLALRAQLAAELPTYLALLHQGLSISVRRLADVQMRFWKDMKDRWGELWEMLRVDGELNAGRGETVAVWRSRWIDVDEVLASLNINQSRKIYQEPGSTRSSGASVHPVLANMEYPLPQTGRKQLSNIVLERPTHGRDKSGSITSFFKGDKDRGDRVHESPTVPNLPEPDSRYKSHSDRDRWVTEPAKYVCQVLHSCQVPATVSYFSFPFFTLVNGDLYEVLQEAEM
ncbi:hypothetical protein EST38_g13084 [Candolleomyces aberdarensis]|uniref:DH domain-containing protein n=1 Tax=Candolleomyces aberdarensis TaxID=2316362 RepID=A0A4Q2D1Z6_9AGAR|nr:hypothetical protein EST38_g13084 [Candolleomyces aberdarensis]